MADIDDIKLRRLDLTVLLVFLGLMRHRKAVTVATEMGVTQSSISHSLGRLRDVFNDALFFRLPHGLEPTAVALDLEPKVHLAVEALRKSLQGPDEFEPTKSDLIVRLSAYDYELTTIVPDLIARLEREAPNMRITALPLARAQALAGLTEGSIDLALGFFWDLRDDFVASPAYEENYRVVARAGRGIRFCGRA